MIIAGQRLPIVIATRPVDFRRGHDGLAATVQNELGLDPHSGLTVIFRSKRGDRLKILVWDGTGLVLVYKRLEQGSFAWPKVQDGVMRLSRAQKNPTARANNGVKSRSWWMASGRMTNNTPKTIPAAAPTPANIRRRDRAVSWVCGSGLSATGIFFIGSAEPNSSL
jgi:transposase